MFRNRYTVASLIVFNWLLRRHKSSVHKQPLEQKMKGLLGELSGQTKVADRRFSSSLRHPSRSSCFLLLLSFPRPSFHPLPSAPFSEPPLLSKHFLKMIEKRGIISVFHWNIFYTSLRNAASTRVFQILEQFFTVFSETITLNKDKSINRNTFEVENGS